MRDTLVNRKQSQTQGLLIAGPLRLLMPVMLSVEMNFHSSGETLRCAQGGTQETLAAMMSFCFSTLIRLILPLWPEALP